MGIKRINLSLSESDLNGIQTLAHDRGTSAVDVIRNCIRVGLLMHSIQQDPDKKLIVRTKDGEAEVYIV